MALRSSRVWRVIGAAPVVAFLASASAGCSGEQSGEAAPGAGGPPAMDVKVVTLAEKPIPQSSEYIATLKSLRSTTIQSQVEGIVTRVLVASGARVRPGQTILQLEASKDEAALKSLLSRRAALVAEMAFAKQQADRATALLRDGAMSRQDLDQAQTALATSEAQLAALDAQIREQRVQLSYFQVRAPVAGVVGDIVVREGDRVTSATEITTIDQSAAAAGNRRDLEAHVSIPLERAADLRVGLPLEFLDSNGKVIATNNLTFVAPRVDEATQTVLVKSLLKDVPASMRVQQYIRARLVWQTSPGLTVPVVAVTRISGQHFAFVAEPQGQGFVARQRPLKVGSILGDDYVVNGGLKAGERLIVSGIQKLGDGVPVKPG
ncbi:MAG TPA: efflux RND transporter periplasmic adaptor subunit [Vicinamibacterales bacterium]|jgi:RND family efflux transporter MFP subunit|nr:efflux RND transporter periplasmic adaptor subunit [Vicinamibacterales bacterium]